MKTGDNNSKYQQEQGTKGVIHLDDLAKINPDREPKFLEEIRHDKNGEITAYALKRNPNYRK